MTQSLNEYDPIASVVVKHVREAFNDNETIAAQWKALNYPAPPDLARAIAEHDRFIDLLRSTGANVRLLPHDPVTTLDSIYVRDASIISQTGLILCSMGKAERATEPAAQQRALEGDDVAISGAITAPGRLEGGDLIWIDERTLAVGRGYRTNADGIRQLRALVGDKWSALWLEYEGDGHWRLVVDPPASSPAADDWTTAAELPPRGPSSLKPAPLPGVAAGWTGASSSLLQHIQS